MGETLAQWVYQWRYLVIVASIAFVAIAASGIRFLEFRTDYRVFFSDDNPQLSAFEEIQDTYAKYDNLLFVLAPKDANVFTRQTLEAVEWLTNAAWQVPYSTRVDSLSNFQYTSAEDDDLIVRDLYTDARRLSDNDLRRIREIALKEPLLRNRLIPERAHVTGVNVTVQLPEKDLNEEVPEVAGYGRRLAQQMRDRYPHLDIHLTGIVMMNVSFPEASQKDSRTLIPIMFLVVMATLLLMLRSISGTVATLLVVAFSIVGALGLAGWFGFFLTGPSAASPIIILTLAVADCVHILVNFINKMRAGLAKRDAMKDSLRINLQPIFLTSVTTAIGFLSMNFSDAPPFRDLGNIVTIGVILAFVFSVVFLPALLMVIPVNVQPVATRGTRAMQRLAEFVIRRRHVLLWGLGPALLLLVAFIPRNEINDEFIKYFDETIEFRRATEFSTANLTGIYTIQFSLQSGESSGISKPEYLQMLEKFAQWFRDQPEVIHVSTLTDILKRLNKNLHGDDPGWHRVPEQRDLAAQYLLLYEMSLPYGLDLNDQINVDKSATRFVVTTENLSTRQTLDLEERARSWLTENALPAMRDTKGSSPNIMFAHIGARNIHSMLLGTTVALVLISLVLVLALRSVKIGLISMVPNLIPAALAFGLWGLLVGRVGLALSVVSAMSLGIVVDDTVHFLSKYLRARRENNDSPPDAVRYAFSSVGMALWVTSVVLIAGFLVLSQSAFEVNSGMGLMTAITISFALIADFLFLPPVLMKAEENQ